MNRCPLALSWIWPAPACVLLSVLLYWPTLGLSWSLIDDCARLQYSSQAVDRFKSEGAAGFLAKIVVPEQNLFGPTFWLAVIGQRLFFGLHPLAWHAAKILSHTAVLLALCVLVRLAGGRAGSQALAVLSFCFLGPQSVFPDFQTYYAAFARLFVSDTYAVPLCLWAAVALIRAVAGPRRKARRAFGAYIALVCVVCLVKINALHLLGACGFFLLTLALASRYAGRSSRPFGLWFAATIAAAVPGLLFFRPWQTKAIFAYQDVEIASGWLIHGSVAMRYAEWTTESLGVLWIVAILMAVVRIARPLRNWKRPRGFFRPHMLARFLLILCFAASFGLQCKWAITTPRYMVVFSPYICALFGVEIGAVLGWLRRRQWRRRGSRQVAVHVSIGAAGVAAWLWPLYVPLGYSAFRPAWAGLGAVVLLTAGTCGLVQLRGKTLWRGLAWSRQVPFWAVAGLLFWQAVVQVLYTHDSAANYYARENLNTRLLERACAWGKQIPENQTGTIYTNLEGEELGSADGLARDFLGASRIRIASFPKDGVRLGPWDRIAIRHDYNHMGPTRIPPFAGGRPVFRLFPAGQADGALGLAPGEKLQRPVSVVEEFAVSLAGLDADPFSWPSFLDVPVAAKGDGGEAGAKEMTRFEGRSMTRVRSGAKIQALEEPFILSPAAKALQLTCESTPGGLSPIPWEHVSRCRIMMTGISFDSSSGKVRPVPSISLWGAPAAIPPLPLLERDDVRVRALLFASPVHLFRLCLRGALSWKGWHPSSFRPIRYEYAMEFYGPSA